MSTELLTQLQSLIAGAEANQVDADKWCALLSMVADMGYGPRITPQQIADLLPNVHGINEIAGYSQEVVPASPTGSKFPRRKLTAADEREIRSQSDDGRHPEQIAADLGVSCKAVVAFLERD